MGVDDEVFLAAGLVFKQTPGGGAEVGGVPALGGRVRGLGEPEGAPFGQGKLLLVVEDGHILPCLLAVIPADADPFVIVQEIGQRGDLVGRGFLQAEDVGTLVLDHLQYGVRAEFPGIGTVLGVGGSYIEGHDGGAVEAVFGVLFRGRGKQGREEEQKRCQLSHRDTIFGVAKRQMY